MALLLSFIDWRGAGLECYGVSRTRARLRPSIPWVLYKGGCLFSTWALMVGCGILQDGLETLLSA